MTLLDIQYIGEWSKAAFSGTAFLTLASIFSLISFVLYAIASKKDSTKLKLAGRATYILHFLLILGSGILLFLMLKNHRYEFAYVWKHNSNELPLKYIVSGLWAGQEGSFLLWIFLQGLMGMLLVFTAKKWESITMAVVALGQFVLSTMILGFKVFGFQLGQSPFLLLRNSEQNVGSEFFLDPNYLMMIADGNGINPLLENYWMVIHPPVLFLGYASTIVPFAFAIGALVKREYHTWLKPAFPWTGFSLLVLATGILLGGAWAYESLTFGGFWAWDPVENASLIPWLVMLATLHMMIINRKQKHSYGMSFLLVTLSYLLVIYASYLTRSGVLGATSVHAFGNNGLSTQMIVIMLLAVVFTAVLYIRNIKSFPKMKQDNVLSREFWMFLGVIVILLSAFQIFVSTSVPVFNKLFGSEIAPPQDVVGFYNKWQTPFAVLIVFLTSMSLVLRYGKNNALKFFKRLLAPIISAAVLFVLEVLLFKIEGSVLLALLFFSALAVTASFDYLIRNRFNLYGMSNVFSHLGAAIMMTGIIAAFSQSQVISGNTTQYDLGDEETNKENQVLFKGEMKQLGPYQVKYDSLERDGTYLIYTLNFYEDNEGTPELAFQVQPTVNVNKTMGNVFNPATYHSLSKDVFTFINYADIEADMNHSNYKSFFNDDLTMHDTIILEDRFMVLDSIWVDRKGSVELDYNNIDILGRVILMQRGGIRDTINLTYQIQNGRMFSEEIHYPEKDWFFKFKNISQEPRTIILEVRQLRENFIVIKSIIFPWISVLWIGAFIMLMGLGLSVVRNIRNK